MASRNLSYKIIEGENDEPNFAALVEEVKRLSGDQKEELKYILEQYILEERRGQIHKNYKESLRESQSGALNFTGDAIELRKMMEE